MGSPNLCLLVQRQGSEILGFNTVSPHECADIVTIPPRDFTWQWFDQEEGPRKADEDHVRTWCKTGMPLVYLPPVLFLVTGPHQRSTVVVGRVGAP